LIDTSLEPCMQTEPSTVAESGITLPVLMLAEVQDSLLVATHDLGRLDGLLQHASDNLMAKFDGVIQALGAMGSRESIDVRPVRDDLYTAVTELQFHDMASQLIMHTTRTLRHCADRLAVESMRDPDDDPDDTPFVQSLPDRPNPVTQSEMDGGSVELF
jgi:hypothetical protein